MATHPQLLADKAMGQFRQGQFNAAFKTARAGAKEHPRESFFFNLAGLAQVQGGNPRDAIDWFRKAIRVNPSNVEAQNNLAQTLTSLGETKTALDLIEKFLLKRKDNDVLLYLKAMALNVAGQNAAAKEALDTLLAAYPNDARALNLRGTIRYALGEENEASQDYQASLSLRPNSPDVLANFALLLSRAGRMDDALASAQLTRIFRGTQAKKEYLTLFPSLNASYALRENLTARAAYYHSVGRPNFNQYAGGVTLPDAELPPSGSNRITVNNASIKAWQAETYMARVEYYFGTVGTLSVSGFIRDYTNFFVNVTSPVSAQFLETYGLDETEYGGIQVITQFNDPENIRQHGFEIDYKQSLTFLPKWASGVQVFANFSSQRAKGTDNMQDMNPFVMNWGVSLNRPKWNLRINENYRGIQRRGIVASTATNGIEPGTYNYRPKRLYIDVLGEYNLSRRFALFANLRNLNDATEDFEIAGPSTPAHAQFRQRTDFAALWTFGLKGKF